MELPKVLIYLVKKFFSVIMKKPMKGMERWTRVIQYVSSFKNLSKIYAITVCLKYPFFSGLSPINLKYYLKKKPEGASSVLYDLY